MDAYSVTLKNKEISIEDIYINVFAHSPTWINNLLKIRNKIVEPFGIKASVGEIKKEDLKVGGKAGIFRIFAIQKNELIAGEDEKHLNFRVSVLKTDGVLTISTLVQYNNWFGKVYFFIVKPFHKIIVKSMIKNAVKNNRI